MTAPARPSLIKGLLRRRKREAGDASDEADQELDRTLHRLSKALNEHATISQDLARRQSSGGFKIVPVDALGEAVEKV